MLDDVGLSRVNTTFFRDGEMLLVVDEKSLNGTFLNGEKIGGKPVRVLDGDKLKLGVETLITVAIEGEKSAAGETAAPKIIEEKKEPAAKDDPQTTSQNPKSKKPPLVIIGAVISTFLIIFLALTAIVLLTIS